ncbi:DUF881 domain-containing protein [Naumannella sp. ID2617S]|nr:DUF881 domain-containing protein [Naumannella sp. ID2617S]
MSPRLLPTPRRPDASMDLLNQILRQPLDPDYAIVAERERSAGERGTRRPGRRLAFAVVAAVIGVLFSLAAVQTTRSAPAASAERQGLIDQIRAGERRQDELRGQLQALRTENDTLRRGVLSGDDQAHQVQAQVDELAPATGDTPVKGPGVVVIVDDAPVAREDRLNRVLDRDLQQLTNGLWAAGAEAVAINGHRLTARTAIRSAGDAITVDYRSLGRPYRIEAIGDQRSLPARFADSQGGRQWAGLQQNYKLRFEVSQARELQLAGDPGFGIREARRLP